MPVSTTLTMAMPTVETLPADVPGANAQQITHNALDIVNKVLNSGSTPAITLIAVFQAVLSGGALTLDLTSLTGTNGATVNGNGLKVQAIRIQAPATNANPITVVGGASNGYLCFGTAGKITMWSGSELLFFPNAGTPTIGGSTKTIDLAGTGVQVLNFEILMG